MPPQNDPVGVENLQRRCGVNSGEDIVRHADGGFASSVRSGETGDQHGIAGRRHQLDVGDHAVFWSGWPVCELARIGNDDQGGLETTRLEWTIEPTHEGAAVRTLVGHCLCGGEGDLGESVVQSDHRRLAIHGESLAVAIIPDRDDGASFAGCGDPGGRLHPGADRGASGRIDAPYLLAIARQCPVTSWRAVEVEALTAAEQGGGRTRPTTDRAT
ncbi:hypothetical protein D3C80_1262370 [compost metagenome]